MKCSELIKSDGKERFFSYNVFLSFSQPNSKCLTMLFNLLQPVTQLERNAIFSQQSLKILGHMVSPSVMSFDVNKSQTIKAFFSH